MKIENLRSEKNGNRSKVAATVVWEDCNRPSQELYFETEEAFAERIVQDPVLFAQLKIHAMNVELELEKEDTKRLGIINETMRFESKSENKWQGLW